MGSLARRAAVLPILLCTCIEAFSPSALLGRGLRSAWNAHSISLRPALSTRIGLRPPQQRAGRSTLLALQAQAGGDIENIQLQVETGLIIGLPEATQEDIEELMAILTVATRSLSRKVAKDPSMDVGNTLLDNLERTYVEEECILTAQQWASVRSAVRLPTASAAAPSDPASAVQAAKASIDSMLDSFIASQGMPEDDASEIRAISLALSRSITRRAQGGKISVGNVKSVFEGEVRARLDEEALVPAASWDAMMGGAAPPPAAAPRQVATPPTEKPASERVAEFVDELERLFPDTDGQVLKDAAQGQTELEDAVYNVITNTARQEEEDALEAGRSVAPTTVSADGSCVLTTPPVTTGACCFGLAMDIEAKSQPLTITSIKTASSPGLNWGKGGPVRMKVFVTEGGSRGKELDASKWTLIGEDKELTLPAVSWADTEPQYAAVPLSQPIRIEAGCKAGFVLHSSDLYGLVMTVGSGSGGDVDFWEEEGDDPDKVTTYELGSVVAEDDYMTLSAGYSLGGNVFEEFDNAMMPRTFPSQPTHESMALTFASPAHAVH